MMVFTWVIILCNLLGLLQMFQEKRHLVQVDVLTLNKLSYLKIEAVGYSETSETPKCTTRCNSQNKTLILIKSL
jgi:hypothetical protein